MSAKKYLHLLTFPFNLLLLFLLSFVSGSAYILIAVIFIIINCLYLVGSINLLTGLIKKKKSGLFYLPVPEYSWVIVFNLMLSGTIILSTFFFSIFTVTAIYLAQIPRAVVIYYTYFKILNRADFSN
jgi:hypothetical protein